MSLFAKLVRGSTLNLADHGLKLVLMFITTPLMIGKLGEHDYGTWLLALAIVAYFKLLDMGLSFSGTRFLGKAIGAENSQQFASLVHSLFRMFLWIGFGVIALSGITVAVLPFFLNDSELIPSVRLLVAGFGFLTAIRFGTRIFEVILKSHVRYDLISAASLAKSAIQGGLVITFLLSGHGIMTLLVIYLLSDLIDQILLVLFARKVEPGLSLRSKTGTSDVKMAELLKYSATAMAASTGHSMRHGIDPLIIARVSGVSMIPIYSVGARFLSVFADIVNAIFGGNFVAVFSQIHGRNDPELMLKTFLSSIRLSSALATLGGGALLFYGPAFIERWVGNSFQDSATILNILTVPTVLGLMQYPIWGFFYSQNKQHWLAAVTLGGGIFNLGLSLLLAHWMGFFGVIWATLIEGTIAFGILVPIMVTRICQIRIVDYAKPILSSLCIIGISSAGFYALTHHLILSNYPRIILLGSAHLALALAVSWFLILSESERKRICQLVPGLKSP